MHMKSILLAGLMALGATTASNACTVNADSFFKGPGCVVVDTAGQVVGYGSQYTGSSNFTLPELGEGGTALVRDHGNANGSAAASVSVTRNYALGDQPAIGKKGKQSVPNGLREVSRRTMSQALASKSTLTGPAVHTDPKTGAKTLRSVEITYSNSRGTSRGSTSGPGQQR